MRCKSIKFSIITLLILGLSFVFAIHIITPTSFSVNETIENLFNITIENTDTGDDANITQVNITIPSEFTFIAGTNGTNVSADTFVNTSTVLSWTNTTIYFIEEAWTAHFWFNATATPGTYNFTITTVNITSSYNTNITVTVNDTTNPTATLGTSPVNNTNSSTAANTFDIKCSDAYNASTMVLWGNWSGTWAANNTNTSVTNDTYSNISVTLSDGSYVWGAYCNDTTGNADWTANRTLIVDTTNPSATASCTPATVYEGNLVTCTCTGTDATSGINSSATTSGTAVYQRTVGTYTYTCSVTDYSGNSGTATDTYTVIGYGGPSSSTTTTWTGTQLITATQFKESFSKELSVKERLKMKVGSIYHHVGIKELTATTATIEVASTPQEAILSIGDERKFEVSGDNYYDILIKLNSIENNKANITVQSINELITAEAIEEGEQQQQDSAETKQEEQPPTTEAPEETSKNILIWIIIAIIAIVIIIYFKLKKK